LLGALLAASCLACGVCAAIDNPDTADLEAQFQQRAAAYETRIAGAANTTQEMIAGYADYQRFLEAELERAYRSLLGKLDPASRLKLVQAQRRWRAYRDAEFRLIEGNWTQSAFGTSAGISRGAYRSSIVKDRTVQLIEYLKNYPP
jgi:uncharacterized protein YecT (DUF1311 family)